MGKATFEFAFVMDQVKEERERGVTIDVAHKRFDTDKYYFTIIDAPGHRDFVKNMITGTSQADAAVLVVGAAEGVQTQTKEHIYLAKVLGVEQIIVAINKMDATKPEYSEKRFTELKTELTGLLKVSGFKVDRIPFIPISSYKGENITKPSSKMSWYKGPALVPAFNDLTVPPKPTNLPLRLPVQDVYSITGAPKAEKPDFLKTGDAARVKIRPTKPLVIEAFKAFPQMGRFAVRDMGQTVAAGQVIEVEKR